MSQELALTLVALVCSSCVMMAALVPFTAEVIAPSKTMREHRRRLRRFGAPGALAEKLLPRLLDGGSPLRVWGALYAFAWLGLLITFGALIRDSEPKDLVNNLVVVTIIVGAWWCVQFVVVILSRVLIRVNDPTRHRALQRRTAEMAALEMPGLESEPSGENVANSAPPGRFASIPTVVFWGGVLLGVAAINGMVDKVPLFGDVDAFFHERQALFLGVAISLTAAGAIAFLGGIVSMIISSGRPMTKEEIERLHAQLMAAPHAGIARGARYRLVGEQVGAEAVDEFSMAAMKCAWNAGLWWSVPLWRRRFLMTAGAFALLGGVAGLAIVLSSLGYKLLATACVVYVFVRTALAFRRAG
jgi:hypothetical protein